MSILNVASLKPEADMSQKLASDAPRLDTRFYSSVSTVGNSSNHADSFDAAMTNNASESHRCSFPKKATSSSCRKNLLKDVDITNQTDDGTDHATETKSSSGNLDSCPTKSSQVLKRKGDLEFDLQMEVALSATAAGTYESKMRLDIHELPSSSSSPTPLSKNLKKTHSVLSINNSSSAVWSRKNGPPLHWAELYCSSEALTGRWVHIDAANGVIDGEGKVEAAVAACRKPLKYAVAFAGNGAKDVTHRFAFNFCQTWISWSIFWNAACISISTF